LRNQGYGAEVFDGRPAIGIATTWSELAPCNAHFDRLADAVKRGVWPLVFPVMATGESLIRPTAMYYRTAAEGLIDQLGLFTHRRRRHLATTLRRRLDHLRRGSQPTHQ
jgi:hypothetical protein